MRDALPISISKLILCQMARSKLAVGVMLALRTEFGHAGTY